MALLVLFLWLAFSLTINMLQLIGKQNGERLI